jgi:hypothetical protein
VAVRAFFTDTNTSSLVIASTHRVIVLDVDQQETRVSTIYSSLDIISIAEAGSSGKVWVHNRKGDVTVLDKAGNTS